MRKVIVQTDNFGMSGEAPAKNELILLWSMTEEHCKAIAAILNEDSGEHGSWYYKVEDFDYEPRVWLP